MDMVDRQRRSNISVTGIYDNKTNGTEKYSEIIEGNSLPLIKV